MSIPLDRVVFDTLHLFLRISDRLTEKLVRDCEVQDSLIKKPKGKPKPTPHMDALEALFIECGIHGVGFFADKSGVRKPRDLTGPEKHKLFKNLDKVEALVKKCRNDDECSHIISVWREFYSLYDLIRMYKELGSVHVDGANQIESLSKQWLQLYVSIFTSENLTPYLHLLTEHVAQIIRVHGSIVMFNCQGLEKKNHIITVDYFKSTNHQRGSQGINSLSQMMRKYNRNMFFFRKQISLQKRQRTCSHCQDKGHDIRICPKKNI